MACRYLKVHNAVFGQFWEIFIVKSLKLFAHILIFCPWSFITVFFSLISLDMPNIRPIVISIWCGIQKPNNLDEYLSPFVNELNSLLENGIIVNGYHICIEIRCFICDSPARAFLKGINIYWNSQNENENDRIFFSKGTVNFNHTFGCQKCVVQGKFSKIAKRIYFERTDCELRTDSDFRTQTQKNHHKQISKLQELPIDMIRSFVTSDPLHLLELGVMKRYIQKIWRWNRMLMMICFLYSDFC